MSRGFAQAVVDVGIAYREDTDEAFDLMRAVAHEMRNDEVFGPKILEDLEIAGVASPTRCSALVDKENLADARTRLY